MNRFAFAASRLRAAAVAVALLLAGVAAAAQQAKPRRVPQAPFTFRANVGEVLVHASVYDRHHRAVLNLPESDFTVYENGVPQHIEYFAHSDAPVSVGILVDNSGSMRDKRPEVDKAALNFVRASNPQDEEFIVNFNDEYYLDAPFTNSLATLQKGLEQIESRGGTALYDAVIASLDYLNRNAKNDKRVLLVITDGDDDASRYTLEQTVRMVQSENPPLIYCIGLLDSDDTGYMKKTAKRALKALADATGGVAYFPKNLAQVNTITREVATAIRAQYTLAYHSNQTGDGFRAIRVLVKDRRHKHLIVDTRKGYYHTAAATAGR